MQSKQHLCNVGRQTRQRLLNQENAGMPAASLLRVVAVSLLLVAALPGRTRADDWRMFRRDGRRTAASSDRLRFPLTQLWSVVPQLESSILYDVAVAEGRVYYL